MGSMRSSRSSVYLKLAIICGFISIACILCSLTFMRSRDLLYLAMHILLVIFLFLYMFQKGAVVLCAALWYMAAVFSVRFIEAQVSFLAQELALLEQLSHAFQLFQTRQINFMAFIAAINDEIVNILTDAAVIAVTIITAVRIPRRKCFPFLFVIPILCETISFFHFMGGVRNDQKEFLTAICYYVEPIFLFMALLFFFVSDPGPILITGRQTAESRRRSNEELWDLQKRYDNGEISKAEYTRRRAVILSRQQSVRPAASDNTADDTGSDDTGSDDAGCDPTGSNIGGM